MKVHEFISTSFALRTLLVASLSAPLMGCEGAFGWVYDNTPEQGKPEAVAGQFYLDASDWRKWHFLDLPSAAAAVQQDSLHDVSDDIVTYDIPLTPTGETETQRGTHQRNGQYVYYFDVFNEGIEKNQFHSFTPTEPQPEPSAWTIAMHRNNVRTNGAWVHETKLTDINLVTREMCQAVTEWQQDEWSENQVWDDQSTMLSCYVPSQGIKINRVLSSWLTMKVPPMPPSFVLNSNVMLLRLADGSFGALQLIDYLSPQNKKCCLTVKYKYPI